MKKVAMSALVLLSTVSIHAHGGHGINVDSSALCPSQEELENYVQGMLGRGKTQVEIDKILSETSGRCNSTVYRDTLVEGELPVELMTAVDGYVQEALDNPASIYKISCEAQYAVDGFEATASCVLFTTSFFAKDSKNNVITIDSEDSQKIIDGLAQNSSVKKAEAFDETTGDLRFEFEVKKIQGEYSLRIGEKRNYASK